MACKADGATPKDVIGGECTFELDALVVRHMNVNILTSNPFMARNDSGIRPVKRQILIGGSEIISYGSPSMHTLQFSLRRTQQQTFFRLRDPLP